MAKQTTKQLVFISHIEEEKQVASALKELVESVFLGMIETFIASDPNSIEMGTKWLDMITSALKRCSVEIVIASPASIKRPWVNFEMGGGWIRDVPVVPVCHSGLTVPSLPAPLGSLQAAEATNETQLANLFSLLARTLNCKLPPIDYKPFIAAVEDFHATSTKLLEAAEKSLIGPVAGLEEFEIAALVAIAECTSMPGDYVYPHVIRKRLDAAGYTDIAGTLGLAGLVRKGLIETKSVTSDNFNSEPDTVCTITPKGWHWLTQNHQLFTMRSMPKLDAPPNPKVRLDLTNPPPDEIPF